jgi:hypothetical protein
LVAAKMLAGSAPVAETVVVDKVAVVAAARSGLAAWASKSKHPVCRTHRSLFEEEAPVLLLFQAKAQIRRMFMSLDTMLAALQGLYDVPIEEDTSTVRGLLRYCRGWLRDEVTAEQLHNPCWEMSGRLRSAAEATFRDLDQNPNLSEEAREPILATAEGYEAIVSILEELPVLAAENQRGSFADALEDFEAERLAILDATEEINAQMSGRVCRCPRCGQSGDVKKLCNDCGLDLLYPDPKQLQDYSYKSARLSPIHVRVYNAFISVKQGKAPLETLMASLPPLSAHLRDLTRFCDQPAKAGAPPWLVPSLRQSIQLAQKGLERMAGVSATRRISDLNRAWEDIFESSVEIRAHLTQAGTSTGQLQVEQTATLDGFSV